MYKLRSVLKAMLKTYHPNVVVDGESKSRVHFHQAPTGSPFPKLVFDLPTSFMDEQQEVFNLDIDIWDDKEDTTSLEDLAGKLWKELNYYRHIDDDMQFSIYRENRLPPIDEDEPKLKRRKLIFQLRYFDRRLF